MCSKVLLFGPILLRLYLIGLLYLNDFAEVCNFADYTAFHAFYNDLIILIMRLERDPLSAI